MSIQITFTLDSVAAAAALFAKLNGTELGHVTVSPGVSAAEKAAVADERVRLLAVKLADAVALGKPSAAKTARSQPTAAADPSTPDQPAAVPATEPKSEATQPAATVDYASLQKAVLTLHKLDSTAAVPIAQSLGADTFKLLPAEKWPEALAAVNAAIAERKAA